MWHHGMYGHGFGFGFLHLLGNLLFLALLVTAVMYFLRGARFVGRGWSGRHWASQQWAGRDAALETARTRSWFWLVET
jgi:hypothetical protein